MNSALETKLVSKAYTVENTPVKAVDNVSMQVNPVEFVALVGPSGSGKTTMLAMLAGLLSPSAGTIKIGGQEIAQMDEATRTRFRRKNIGFTFQANNLVPYLTALENVELMLKLNDTYKRDGRQKAINLLAKLGLDDRLNNLPSQLSGGQQQRVAIARSLVHDPGIVLADEPTASLDTERAYQVVQTFANLIRSRNLAGIMVTHDLRMCRYVDKIIQMQDGRLQQIITGKPAIERFAALQ